MFFAGNDTSSHTLSSLLFNVKKHSDVFTKLQAKISASISKPSDITKEWVDSNDFLHYVVKESLRYDSPAPASLEYISKDDFEICNVPINKGHKMFVSIHGLHNDPTQYKEPSKFIPDRFDPESEYFLLPKNSQNKARSPHAFMGFGTGLRNCPGKSLAMLEIKVIASYILSRFNYQLDPEQLANKDIKFAGVSQFQLKITPLRKN